MITPSLFDTEPAPQSWQEVPQARFLSWSGAMQHAYCAARDEHSATQADAYGEHKEAAWYRERARLYKETT